MSTTNYKKDISVIVPVYNVEKYVRKCIESILMQTYKNIEIILIDDGSTDKSGIICDEYAKKDNRINVIHQKNKGVSLARNKGIENATGKYLFFIDPDDYIEYNTLEYLLKLLIVNKADISICGYMEENENYDSHKKIKIANNLIIDNYAGMQMLINGKIQNYIWNKLYKIELFNDIRFPINRVMMEDFAIMYKVIAKSNIIAIGNKCLYHYIQRVTGCSKNKNLKHFIDEFEISKERYLYLKHTYDIKGLSIAVIKSCLDLFIIENELEKYIKDNKVKTFFYNLLKEIKNEQCKIDLKTKIRIVLYKINRRLYVYINKKYKEIK